MKKVRFEDQGYHLPIGKERPDGTVGRSFAFKPWRAKDERHIGGIRDKNRKMSSGAFTSEVLAYFLTEWQGEDWENKKIAERKLALNQSYAADIYYAWVMLRKEALGDECVLDICCGQCRHKFQYNVSLESVEVDVAEDGEILSRPHKLRDGFDYRGELRTVATLSPLRWAMFESFKSGSINTGDIKLGVIAASLIGLNSVEGEVLISPRMLDDLTKFDLEGLSARMNDRQPGPDFRIEVQCPECSFLNEDTISWVYDSFFSTRVSSLSEPPVTSSPRSSSSVEERREASPSTPTTSVPAIEVSY